MSSRRIVKPVPRLTSIHNLRSTKQTTSLNVIKAAKPVKIDRLSSLPSELILLVFDHLRICTLIRYTSGNWLHRWTTALLSKRLRPFQQLNLYFSIKINSVKMLKSLCASLQVSKLGKMIKHLSLNLDLEQVESEDNTVTKALTRLAKLVPSKFTHRIYKQVIEVMYECAMKRRIDQEIEEMGEDPFDYEMEEMIAEEEEGDEFSRDEAECNLAYEIEQLKQDREAFKDDAVQADLDDPETRIELRKQYHDLEADDWRTYFEGEERSRLETEFTDELGQEMREAATSRAKKMFKLK